MRSTLTWTRGTRPATRRRCRPGRYVAFVSQASNLVEDDTGDAAHVFVRDRARGRTTLVSVGPGGHPGDADSAAPSVSADGRYMAFTSAASNLVDGDTNGLTDVFVRDLVSATTRRVSVSSGGAQADGPSGSPVISADGRTVAFTSRASNFAAGDTNETTDVFVHEGSGATTRVSVSSGGGQADGASGPPSISGDARYVVFAAVASNLVSAAANPRMWHVVHQERDTGRTSVVTRRADGPSRAPVASDDGRVAFVSQATNLSPHWPHIGFEQVYEWRRHDGGERMVQMSVHDYRGQADADSHQPAISANGYVVAYVSSATSLTAFTRSGVPNVFAHTWVGGACIAVLVSAADLQLSRFPPPGGGTDDDRSVYLYRGGSFTAANFTLRPAKDTDGYPHNGLSIFSAKARACEGQSKVQLLAPEGIAAAASQHLAPAPDPADPVHFFLQVLAGRYRGAAP